MSHIVTIQTQVRAPAAIELACGRLRLPAPTFGAGTLFTETATGWQVQLPEWHYPVVCDVAQGRLHFDNFNGRWGRQEHLDLFLQSYAIEKAKLEARKRGYSTLEHPNPMIAHRDALFGIEGPSRYYNSYFHLAPRWLLRHEIPVSGIFRI